MHWSEELAEQIIARNPDKREYVCAAGISPSGSIHIGNFRDIATSYFVVKALRKKGKQARLLFSWDEFDRMRKVPVNVSAVRDDMEKYIGCPYTDVPNPFPDDPASSYAEHFEKEFMESVRSFGIEMDYRYQTRMYRSGAYAQHVLTALKKRGEIFDILDRHRTQEAQPGERESYYPVSIYCPACGRDTTTIHSLSEDCTEAEYSCACGHRGLFNFTKDFNCKLAWKVDWPMRWLYEGVDFEPGGKDHASLNGSYDNAKDIAKEIFGYEAPLFQGYEFIGIRGQVGKMSGSSGLNMTPGLLLRLYQPEVILWLYAKTEPLKAFDFCFDDGILRQYFEYDRMLNAQREGTLDEYGKAVCDLTSIEGRSPVTVPMALLVSLGSVVDFNEDMLETVFAKIGTPYRKADFADRIERAKFWLEHCAPDQVNRLRSVRNWEVFESLSDLEKEEINRLCAVLRKGGYTLDELNALIYAIPRELRTEAGETLDDKTLKTVQGTFFKNVYRLLIDKEKGPRLYLFLYAINPDKYLHLLDFSAPQTEEEKEKAAEPLPQVTESSPKNRGSDDLPDEIPEIKPTVTAEEFGKLDLRVCKILKAQEIRKSHSCLKLTLSDGTQGPDKPSRVIVSSIKNEYEPEELIGRKILVLANLEPARITGVTSEGMLLAATNHSCGCQVIFVDDSVPEGTVIH
ncbi:MAG: lysine--tRNA ligase [Clostridia bacterium]|nr:lysine--tRNA ligase [Clostridia bacterium]